MERSELVAAVMVRIGGLKRLLQGQQYQCKRGGTLSGAHVSVLFTIKQHGPISSHQLAERLSMTPGGVSQLVDALIGDKYLSKQIVEGDRRSFTLQITAKGSELIKHISSEHYAILEKTTSGFSESELALFITMLDKITESLQEKKDKEAE